MSGKYTFPKELKKLKACTQCHLIKTYSQFQKEGCDNCHISKNALDDNLTGKFKGMIAITDTKHSWASRYLDKTDLVPGFYALGVFDESKLDYDDDDE